MTEQPAILAVLPDERFNQLVDDLKASGVTVLHVYSCAVARRILAAEVPICLIVTVPRLPDGSWRGLLTTAVRHGLNPQIMVIAEEMNGRSTDYLDVWHVWTPAFGHESFVTACNAAIESWLSVRRLPSQHWGRAIGESGITPSAMDRQ